MDAADDFLTRCAESLAEFSYQPLKPLSDKLRQDRFNMVLTGGFQNGKSTMFSYLCGGSEISPVGTGCGGTPTSAVRITALAVNPGETEYAVVRWRSQRELLASLGDWLVPHYMQDRKESNRMRASGKYVTTDDINLESDDARNHLAELAKSILSRPTGNKSEIIEQVRMTLLIALFYPYFRKEVLNSHQGQRFDSLKDIVRMSSYPKSWQQRWAEVQKSNWQPGFTKDDVAFIFIHSIEYHIDSEQLRQLGCCLIDSPGLSASKWDTDIAAHCLRESDAILYLFKGDKSVSLDDCAHIERCAAGSTDDKILFGANLRMPKSQWQGNKSESIHILEQNGYQQPSFFDFHAGIALRTAELCALEGNRLSAASIDAIDRELQPHGLPCDDENRRKFLEGTLNEFLGSFTRPNPLSPGKSLNDYKISFDGETYTNYQELEELSGIPAFVKAARRQILARKKESLLRRKGSEYLLAVLKGTHDTIKNELTNLGNQISGHADELDKLEEKWESFEKQLCKDRDQLDKLMKRSTDELCCEYCKQLKCALNMKRADIIGLTANHFVGPFDQLIHLKLPDAPVETEVIHNFSMKLNETLRAVLARVCRVADNQLCLHESFKAAEKCYKELLEFYDCSNAPQQLINSRQIERSLESCGLKRWGASIMESIRQDNVASMWAQLLTAGLMAKSNWERAETVVNKHWDVIIHSLNETLKEIFNRDDGIKGPLRQMWDARDELNHYFDEQYSNRKAELTRAREASHADKEEMQQRINQLQGLQTELQNMMETARELDNQVETTLDDD